MYYSSSLTTRQQNTGMEFSQGNKLIFGINSLTKAVSAIGEDIVRLETHIKEQDSQKVAAHIKPYLLKKKYEITLYNCNHSIEITSDARARLIEGVKKFVNNTKTLPIGFQINSILIKSINRLMYHPDDDMIIIELNIS